MTPHDTLQKFEYPSSLVASYSHWAVLLRPQQATLGSLVIVSLADIRRFSEIPGAGFTELGGVIRDCEQSLLALFSYDKINYLMLMMVDPQVHMHVIPRYSSPRSFEGMACVDEAWPGPPALGASLALPSNSRAKLLAAMKTSWPE